MHPSSLKRKILGIRENVTDSTKYFRNSELFLLLNRSLPVENFKKVLEIGTFEGVFARYAVENFAEEVHTIDPFDVGDEGTKVENKTKATFVKNRSKSRFKEKIFQYEMTSDIFFAENSILFDFVYVDGSHEPEVAARDLENSLRFTKVGGIIWIDDFGSDYKTLNMEIQKFLDNHKSSIRIIHMNYQVGLKKLC